MGGGMNRLLIASLALMAANGAVAQPLVDPMRPPANLLLSGTTRASATPSNTAPAGPIVHTIIIGPDRRYAVIDGRAVAQGDHVRGMRVVRIEESGVVLRDSTGKHVGLDLLAGIHKTDPAMTAQSPQNAISARASKQ